MSAVWRAARAAVRRRRLQTAVIGLVALFATAALVVAVALLDAAHAPFERAFAAQRGAHLTIAFDAEASDEDLAAITEVEHVAAFSGPFDQAVLDVDAEHGDLVPGVAPGPLTVVGRDDPGGPVDRVDLWKGAWADEPGEIVLNTVPDPEAPEGLFPLGLELRFPTGGVFTVVGYAHSLTGTADAWVSADQVAELHPTARQMLYRLDDAETDGRVEAAATAIGRAAGTDSLLAVQSYLTLKEAVASGPGVYVPFLVAFGVLGIAMAVLIVANVVSGAVVSGFRHIGILKTLGFTPRQVVWVYLTMVGIPTMIGSALGAGLGAVAARPLLQDAFSGFGFGDDIAARPWTVVTVMIAVPLVVAVSALVPAARAHRLPAAEAISAGSSPRWLRGQGVQRRLAGAPLPRSVSLGLGLPAVRPGRTAMTMASIVLAVTTVTFATGLVATVSAYQAASDRTDAYQVAVYASGTGDSIEPELDDAAMEAMLRSMDGVEYVTAGLAGSVTVAGHSENADVVFLRGDSATLGYTLVEGRWIAGPGEVAAPSAVLDDYGLEVGDRVVFASAAERVEFTVVGELLAGGPGPEGFFADWRAAEMLAGGYSNRDGEAQYFVRLDEGTDGEAFAASIEAADPSRDAVVNTADASGVLGIISAAVSLTVMLGAVAALGVFNTVVLNTHERRRDLGTLKSIGMTPRQVVAMTVTSMAALGVVSGVVAIPLGMLTHRLVVPLVAEAARIEVPKALLDVWNPLVLTALALAGAALAVLGALIPARAAARISIAEALRSE